MITNFSEDGEEIYSKIVGGYFVTVYPTVHINPNLDKDEVVYNYNHIIKAAVTRTGGADVSGATWDYKWYVEGEENMKSFDIAEGFTYQPSSNPTSDFEEEKIIIVTKNTKGDSTLYEGITEVPIRIYKAVQLGVIQASNEGKAVFNYENNHINLVVNPAGGISAKDGGEWIYEWYQDNSEEPIQNDSKNTYTVIPDSFEEPKEGDVKKVQYFVHVTNIKNGKVMYEDKTVKKEVEIYPHVVISLSVEDDITEVVKGYNDKFTFRVNVNGGVTNGNWTYNWYRDDKVIATNNANSFTEEQPIKEDINDKKSLRYYVQVTNGDMDSPFYQGNTNTLIITVNPEMMLVFKSNGSSANKQEVVKDHKDEMVLSWEIESKNDLSDGTITYTLSQGENEIKTSNSPDSYTFNPEDPGDNSKTEKMTLSCEYKKQDKVLFKDSKSIEITIYPKVTLNVKGRRHIVLLSGKYSNVTYKLEKKGGPSEENRWKYEWYLGGKSTGERNTSYLYYPSSEFNGSLYVKVQCWDSNLTKVIYEETTDQNDLVHVYPAVDMEIKGKDSNEDDINNRDYVMSNNDISLLLKHRGGIDNEESWKCNWKEVVNGKESAYTLQENSLVYTFAPQNNETNKTLDQTMRAKVALVYE